jgi:L-alanine-DL-glutamate epimerase-like enolase superfamily enzyme
MTDDTPVYEVDVRAYTVPTDAPEADGTLEWDRTTVVVVRVSAGGETGTGWTYAPAASAAVVEDILSPVVLGRDATAPVDTSTAMIRAVRNAGRAGVAGMAVSATDIALWDLRARLLGQPLDRLLGGHRDEVTVYGSGGFTSYDDARLTEQLESWLSEGISSVKIKIGESSGGREERDIARIRLARRVIGERTGLFVDANGGYTAKQAVHVGRRVADADVAWFEEPVSSDDLAGLRLVRDHVGADVAAGEYGYDLSYFERMCASDAVDCLQVDVTRCGGVTEWVRVAAVAAAHGLEVSAHCAPGLSVQVGSATPNFRHVEWFHDHARVEDMLFTGTSRPRQGVVRPAESPGHGMTLDEDAADRFRVV